MTKKFQLFWLIELIALLVCLNSFLVAEKLTTLTGVNNPYAFEVYDNHIYVGEKSSISLYSLKDYSLIKKFGNRGEGPGEFKSIPMFKVFPQYLVVNNFGKWLKFSRDGKFIEEKRGTLFKLFLFPVKSNYVAVTIESSAKTKIKPKVISLLDGNLKPIKEIAKKEMKKVGKKETLVIKDVFKYQVYEDKIYLGDTEKGFYLEVFDSNGNRLYEIKKKYQPIKVTDKYKKDFLEKQKKSKDMISKALRHRKYKFLFRDYFPAFRDFRVKDGKIYIFTHKSEKQTGEIIVMDLKGKILINIFVKRSPLSLCSISNGKYFYLEENMDKEEWELFSQDL